MRAITCHRAAVSALFAAFAVVLVLSACRHAITPIDTSPRPADLDGAIGGTVRGPGGSTPIDGRSIEAVNVDTGERLRTITNRDGEFTFRLKQGHYRVEIALRTGEQVIRQPGVMHVKRSDPSDRADFILGASAVVRPRSRTPRPDDGLGSAIG